MLTRRMLKAMGIEEEKIDQIIEAHSETVDALKGEIKEYKESADKLKETEDELAKVKKTLEESKDDSYKTKYEAVKTEYDKFKSDLKAEESKRAKESAYKNLLKDVGISEKHLDKILKLADLKDVTLEDGNIKDADKIKDGIKKEWSEFIVSNSSTGARTPAPPAGSGSTAMTKEQIVAIKDPTERRAAIAQNMNLFNGGN